MNVAWQHRCFVSIAFAASPLLLLAGCENAEPPAGTAAPSHEVATTDAAEDVHAAAGPALDEIRKSQQAKIESGDFTPSTDDELREATDSLVDIAEDFGSDHTRVARAGSAVAQAFFGRILEYERLLHNALQEGMLAFDGSEDEAAIRRYTKILDTLDLENEELRAFLETSEQKMRTVALNNGIRPDEVSSFMRGFFRPGRLDRLLAVRQRDDLFYDKAKEIYELLAAHPGAFGSDESGKLIFFDSVPDMVVQRFNDLLAELDQIALERDELMQPTGNESPTNSSHTP